VATVAIAAAFVASCGEEDFKDEPRAPVPVQLTGVIQDKQVNVSPAKHLGAGPFVITIANQTDATHTVTLDGERISDDIGSVAPGDTIEIRKTLDPGSYEVRAGSNRAVAKEIQPAVLDIGAERENSNSDLLLP